MVLCNEFCLSIPLAGRLAISSGKNYSVGHYTQTFQPDVFITAMLIGTIAMLIGTIAMLIGTIAMLIGTIHF